MTINKVVRIGTVKTSGGRGMSVYCKIKYDGKKLTISGVEGPLPSGNCLGSCGQIDMHLKPEDFMNFAPGWNTALVREFLATWGMWHLNDMQAGTPEQEAELAKHKFSGYPLSHYTWACDVLGKAGLLEVPNPIPAPQDDVSREWPTTYRYGTGWLTKPIPDSVLRFLASLPDADKTPAWV